MSTANTAEGNGYSKKRSITEVIGGGVKEEKRSSKTSYGRADTKTKTLFDGLFKDGFEPSHEMLKKVYENIAQNEAFLNSIDISERTVYQGDKTTLSGVRQTVLMDRFALRDETGKQIEDSPEDVWTRVAWGLAQVEKTPELREYWERKFYDAMKDFHFVPAGRILSGAGTGYGVTYYNCYVVPSPDDSRGGIIDTLKDTVEIMSRAGGVGLNLSTLRPRGAYIKSVNGRSSGPMSWAQLYSVATGDVVDQGGSRRGAMMLMLDDDHPDIEEFITCKTKPHWIEHANLSIAASDAFMEAIKKDQNWDLKWKGEVVKTVKARDLWDQICEAAWKSAEPGFIFMERYNKWSNTWYYENIRCVNPCGEQGLPAWGVCNLGSLNLSAYVSDGELDYKKLADHSRIAMRMLDNVIDSNLYFFEENKLQQLGTRRTGLGTMGLADALIKMKIRYGSDESIPVIEKIYETIRDAAYDESTNLAEEKGSFPYFDREKYLQGYFIKQLPESVKEKIAEKGIRNAVLLSQAPTGTISLFAGASSGIEPVYDFAMHRKDRTGEHIMYHPLYEEWKNSVPEGTPVPNYFVNSGTLTPEDHVKVQATIQKYTDSSISKTVNAPNNYTIEQVKELYMKAYDTGCKGITFYRDGSRDAVLTRIEDKKEEKKEEPVAAVAQPVAVQLSATGMIERPQMLQGFTYRIQTPVGKGYVTINHDEQGNPLEVFIAVSRAGSDIHADADAIGRLISLALRMPTTMERTKVVEEIIDKLRGIGGGSTIGFGNGRVRSLADAIAKVLLEHVSMYAQRRHGASLPSADMLMDAPADQAVMQTEQKPLFEAAQASTARDRDLCNQCGQATLVKEEGCMKCYSCGFSKC